MLLELYYSRAASEMSRETLFVCLLRLRYTVLLYLTLINLYLDLVTRCCDDVICNIALIYIQIVLPGAVVM